MIKEIVEKKIGENMNRIIDSIIDYVGEEFQEIIVSKIAEVDVAIARNSGVFGYGEEMIYVEDEPVCLKRNDQATLIVPISLFGEESGNIIFLHNLLHSISEDCFKDEGFNEVVIDYMANEIGQGLMKRKVNVTLMKNPSYKSSSFYSKLFPLIDSFYKENKGEIIKGLLGEKINLDEKEIRYIAGKINCCINEIFTKRKEVVNTKRKH